MEITRQSSKKRRKVSIDRLSSLPDDVLCHILSFLPTEMSVATSILARRWRLLWAYVPNLDFDCRNQDDAIMKYSVIINRVMLLRKLQSINTFRLRYDDFDFNEYELDTWITSAISRNAQKLDLCLLGYIGEVPQCLFTCKTLVNLRLHFRYSIPSNGVVSLPSLKKLHLYSVENGFPHLLSGCPVLEELIIDEIDELDFVSSDVVISSPTITRLVLNFQIDRYGSYSRDYGVKINVPALRYLQVKGCLSEEISAQIPTSLTEADISFKKDNEILREDYYYPPVNFVGNEIEEDDYYYSPFELNFVDSLCNVKSLKLSSSKRFPVEVFRGRSESIIRFDHLTKLELAAHWLFLTKFLECADNLRVLIIHEVDTDLKCWREPQQVPKCVLSHLGTITIYQFGCTEDEFKFVRYIFRNAQVLKRMEIHFKHCDSCLSTKSDSIKEISLFERGSESCELAFD